MMPLPTSTPIVGRKLTLPLSMDLFGMEYTIVLDLYRNLTLKRIGRLRVCMDPFPIRNGAVPIIPMKRKGRLKRVHTPLMVY